MNKKFTLVELIVSIVVIGILAAIIMLNISDLRLQAEETAYAVNSKEVQTAVDRYKLEYGEYPTTPQPTKDNPQLVELDKIIPEFIRKKPKGDFKVEVDEKGKTTIIKKEGTEDGLEEFSPPQYDVLGCEEAELLGYICIYTAEDLYDIRDNLDAKYILMNDVDLSTYSNWEPIGTADTPFKGELNGNDFRISNLTIKKLKTFEKYHFVAGLFGTVSSGVFEHLTLVNVDIFIDNPENIEISPWGDNGNAQAGGLIGQVLSNPETNSEKSPFIVKDVEITGNIITNNIENTNLGGLVGNIDSEGSEISLDYITYSGEVKSLTVEGYNSSNAAGLVGSVYGYADEMDLIEVNISNISLSDITLVGQSGGGMISDIDVDYISLRYNVNNVRVSGDFKATTDYDSAGGFTGSLNMRYGDELTVNVSDVQVSLDMEGTSVSGFMDNLNYDETNSSILVDDITITGTYKYLEGTLDDYGTVSGFLGNFSSYYSKNIVTFSDIDINTSMTGANESDVSGFMDNYNIGGELNQFKDGVLLDDTHIFKNININSNMYGEEVAGFIGNFNPYNSNLNLDVNNVNISGEVEGIAVATGFINNLNPYDLISNKTFTNINISSNVNAPDASGFIAYYNPSSWDTISKQVILFDKVMITGDITGQTASGVVSYFIPDNGLLDMKFTDFTVSGKLIGDDVAGFSYEFNPNSTRDQSFPNFLLIDDFVFAGEMKASTNVAGLFNHFNYDDTNYTYYDGLYDSLSYTIQNVTLDGKVSISNSETGSYGYLIGTLYTEKRNNSYLFKNIVLSNDLTISSENTSTFKKGIIADSPVSGYGELIFENVQ